MKRLIDNALSPQIAWAVRESGYDAIHVRDIDLHTVPDELVFAEAERSERVIASADTDFGALLALRKSASPSLEFGDSRFCNPPIATILRVDRATSFVLAVRFGQGATHWARPAELPSRVDAPIGSAVFADWLGSLDGRTNNGTSLLR
jgi:hypothetical protein